MKQFAIKLLKAIAITIGVFSVAIIVSYAMRLHEWVGYTVYAALFICSVVNLTIGFPKKRYYRIEYKTNKCSCGWFYAEYTGLLNYDVLKTSVASQLIEQRPDDITIVDVRELSGKEAYPTFKGNKKRRNNGSTNRK